MSNPADVRWAVLVNDEEQYALHPAEAPVPAGWRQDGFQGTEDECIAHVDRHWTDMRPLSLRMATKERTAEPLTAAADAANGAQAHGQ